jgi:hypothetical protein
MPGGDVVRLPAPAAGAGAVKGRSSAFPWLDHLRRDRRGLPVPFINAWGERTIGSMRADHDPVVGGQAMFFDDHGDVPDFTYQSPQRQRQCMVQGLCQVCGKPVPWSRRNLVISGMSVEWQYVADLRREVPVVTEPWMCDRCCAIATTWCPALIRRRVDEKMTVIPVRSQREVQIVVSVGSIDGPGLEWTRQRPVFMHAKLRLLTMQIVKGPDRTAAGGG